MQNTETPVQSTLEAFPVADVPVVWLFQSGVGWTGFFVL